MQTLNAVQWSNPSTFSRSGVHHGYRTAPATVPDLDAAGASAWKKNQIGYQLVRKVWWGMLEPGGFIVPHIDKGPYWVRWHYPIEPAGYVWQEGSELLEAPSEPFEIHHYEPHAVWNPTDKRRVHLIVELDERVQGIDHDRGLELFKVLDEMRPTVEAAIHG